MRQQFWSFWDRFGSAVMLGTVAGVFLLGLLGVSWYSDLHGLSMPFGTQLYITASLFLLENGSLDGVIPWPLEVARWAAPAVLAAAAIGTILSVVRNRVWSIGVRRLRGHLIVIGLGERGLRAASAARKAGRSVAVIEVDAGNSHLRAARRLGIPVIVGSASELARLRAARLERASRVLVFVGDDSETTAIADAFAEFASLPRVSLRSELCCFIAVPDADAAHDLNALTHEHGVPFRREFFNLEDRAGPVIVDRWAGLLTATATPAPIVVVGTNAVGRSVVRSAARQWAARADAETLEVHWLIPERTRAVERLLADAGVDRSVTITVHELTGPDMRRDVAAVLRALSLPPALIVVDERDDAAALSLLSSVEVSVRESAAVVVGVTTGPSLVRLLREHARIELFDVADELGSDEQIARGRLETLGMALHNGYLRQLNRTLDPASRASKPAYRPWAELPDDLRAQNYDAARAARGMLGELGLDIVARTPLLPAITSFDDDVIDALAQAEHARWFRSRNPGAPQPEWASVSPAHAEQSRDQARRLPAILAAAGLQITPAAQNRG